MAGVKISDLSTVIPLSTDLVVLDRPTAGPGAPVTGKATLASLATAIGSTGGATSGTFNEPSPAEFVTTASLSIAGAQGLVYTAGQVGADTYFFVSGAIGGKGDATPGVTVFGGDLVISGNVEIGTLDSALGTDVTFFSSGSIGGKDGSTPGVGVFGGDTIVSGTLYAEQGLSGSLTRLTDGKSYLVAGTNVTIASASNGQVTISAAGGGGGGGSGDVYWSSTQDRAIFTTGSALFKGHGAIGALGSADAPSDLGNDIFFFVSGTKASKQTAVTGTAVFGGDVVISGSFFFASDGGNIVPLDFGVPLTQVGLLSNNKVGVKRSSYSTIQASFGVGLEATTYSSIRSSIYAGFSPAALYQTNFCSIDSSYSGFMQFSDYSAIIASNGANFSQTNKCIAAAINHSSPSTTFAICNQSAVIATTQPLVQGFNNSAVIGGSGNTLNGGFGPLNSSVILGGKNWNIQESDTIAMGAASGGSTRLLVSASAGMYLGGNLQVTGSLDTTAGVTGSLYYSASNAVHWNGNAPVTVAAALDRIAAFINSNIGPIT